MKKIKICILNIIITGLAILAFGLCSNNEASSVSGSQTIADGIYIIRSKIDNKFVLDVNGASIYNGTNVQIYEYSDVPQKKYKVKYLGDGTYSIIASHSNKSLDVKDASKQKGANVQQWEWNSTDAQRWIIKDVGNGYYSIISKCNSLYIDVLDAKAQNFQNVQMCDGNGLDAQKFKFEKVGNLDDSSNPSSPEGKQTIEDGKYAIKSAVNTDYAIDVAGASTANGANIQLYRYSGIASQQFNITYLGDGYYKILASHSNKSIDVYNAGKTIGTNVQQCEQNKEDAQKWIIKDVGNGYYSIVSKCNGLYVDVYNAVATNGTNIQMCNSNGLDAQKFKLEKIAETSNPSEMEGEQTIEDGKYAIKSAVNTDYAVDVAGGSTANGANIQLYKYRGILSQQFNITYLGDGYYKILAAHSDKSIDVYNGGKTIGTNVQQCEQNKEDAQKWIIKDVGNGYYSIISKCNGLYLDVYNAVAANGTNIQMCNSNGLNAQKFKLEKITETTKDNTSIDIDTSKYPGYKEAIEKLQSAHPNWNFELLYTGVKFSDAVAGEYSVRKRNLVPTDYGGEWIAGTTLYDTGWYAASEKAIAYYMDPRNFLNDTDIFQFQDVNDYLDGVCTLEGIKNKVSGSFLQEYATDINTACKNKNVNPYYIIARLFQENGTNPKSGTYKMDGGDNKYYYNPFNIGATGDTKTEVYNNALARAKQEGWDTMEKALEGGIYFCKANWLDNYQNTLYQNRFDIDTRNGTSLYTHQYMQNLMGAYSEARILRSSYANTGKLESEFTFIIPLYEGMEATLSPMPVNSQESYSINVKTTGTYVRIRSDASTDSTILRELPTKGTILLSVQRGINSNWQKVITSDGLIGYISGDYVTQIDDVTTCNYTANVKTNDGNGCNVRIGPSTRLDKVTVLSDGVSVTVIDDSTYKNIDGYDWSRVRLSSGTQVFIPSKYLVKQ
jgi:beta-N-acetylglucosaminidase/P2-related tail formation protein